MKRSASKMKTECKSKEILTVTPDKFTHCLIPHSAIFGEDKSSKLKWKATTKDYIDSIEKKKSKDPNGSNRIIPIHNLNALTVSTVCAKCVEEKEVNRVNILLHRLVSLSAKRFSRTHQKYLEEIINEFHKQNGKSKKRNTSTYMKDVSFDIHDACCGFGCATRLCCTNGHEVQLGKVQMSKCRYDGKMMMQSGLSYDDNIITWVSTLMNGVGGTELQNFASFLDIGTTQGIRRQFHRFESKIVNRL